MNVQEYLRPIKTIYCAGCGNGNVIYALIKAIYKATDEKKISRDKVVIVSGIGCSGRISIYLDFDTIQSLHGRALPLATGIALSRPDLTVFVIMGDGDALAIGGNHFIHACRRNINLKTIVVNNYNYGMTQGQYSPLTPLDSMASTAPYGTIEDPFDACELAKSCKTPFVARSTTAHQKMTINIIGKMIEKKGFSVLEIMSQCPTQYGRRNKMRDAAEMLARYQENAVLIDKFREIPPEEIGTRFPIGILVDRSDRTDLATRYGDLIKKARNQAKDKIKHIDSAERVDFTEEAKHHSWKLSVCLSGSGGQGLQLAGKILMDVVNKEKKKAASISDYGPEARGGTSKSTIVISNEPIINPIAERLDVLLALNQESYDKYAKKLNENGILIIDSQVKETPSAIGYFYRVPFLETAISIGNQIAINMVVLGFLSGVTKVVDKKESLLWAIEKEVKKEFWNLDKTALEKGWDMVKEKYKYVVKM